VDPVGTILAAPKLQLQPAGIWQIYRPVIRLGRGEKPLPQGPSSCPFQEPIITSILLLERPMWEIKENATVNRESEGSNVKINSRNLELPGANPGSKKNTSCIFQEAHGTLTVIKPHSGSGPLP
jgi:hypothetical protein